MTNHTCIVCNGDLDEHSLDQLQICNLRRNLEKGSEVE